MTDTKEQTTYKCVGMAQEHITSLNRMTENVTEWYQ